MPVPPLPLNKKDVNLICYLLIPLVFQLSCVKRADRLCFKQNHYTTSIRQELLITLRNSKKKKQNKTKKQQQQQTIKSSYLLYFACLTADI